MKTILICDLDEILCPRIGGCFEFSYRAMTYLPNCNFAIGVTNFLDTTTSHGINSIILKNGKKVYFDYILEVVNNHKIGDIKFVSYLELPDTHETHTLVEESQFFDCIPFFYFKNHFLANEN